MAMRRNIIFVIDSPFPFYAGGRETWLYNVSSRLCVNNNVIIISENKTFYKESFFYLDERIRVINYDTIHSNAFLRIILRGKLRILKNYRTIEKIKKKLYEITHDNEMYYVVSLTTLFAATAVNRVRSNKDNVRFICSARMPHALIVSQTHPLLRKYLFNMETHNMLQADLALSNGYDTIAYFKKRGIKTELMKNGINLNEFYLKSDQLPNDEMPRDCFNIVSVATLLDIKGINEMIAAIGLLKKKGYKKIRLILVGKGGKEKYTNKAKKIGVEDEVVFLGHRSNVIPYLQYADVICCLSGGSGLSMSALESMASGKPVVAWNTPVYQQFNVTSKTMILVAEKNIELLAKSIEQIMQSPLIFKSMCANGFQEAKKYDWDVVINDFYKHLNLIN